MKHVRMAIYQLTRGSTRDVIDLAQRDLVPILRAQRGFLSYELVTTPHDGLVSWSVWSSKRAAQEAAGLIKQWVDANVSRFIIDSELHIGDVEMAATVGSAPEMPEPV